MEMYSSVVSPSGLRVHLAAAAKGLDIATRTLPTGGVRSDEFLAINPIGKIPVLVTETGNVIAESAAILGYLEHRFPAPALLPAEADARAKMDSACRAVDLYFVEPVVRLFRQLDPASCDAAVIHREVEHWVRGATQLSKILECALPRVEAKWSMLDCMLAPALHLSRRISSMLQLAQDPATMGGLQSCYDSYLSHPGIGPFMRALTEAQESYDLSAGRPSVAARH